MGHYVRILSTSSECVRLAMLKKDLSGFHASLALEAGQEALWDQLILSHADGQEIAAIESNPVIDSSLGCLPTPVLTSSDSVRKVSRGLYAPMLPSMLAEP